MNNDQTRWMVSNVTWGMAIRSILFSDWKSTVRLEQRASPGRRWTGSECHRLVFGWSFALARRIPGTILFRWSFWPGLGSRTSAGKVSPTTPVLPAGEGVSETACRRVGDRGETDRRLNGAR